MTPPIICPRGNTKHGGVSGERGRDAHAAISIIAVLPLAITVAAGVLGPVPIQKRLDGVGLP
jgi:hypothetical protein